MNKRDFHISVVLSVITDKLLSHKGMVGVEELLNFMHGNNTITSDFPNMMLKCRKDLLMQFPEFKSVHVKDVTEISLKKWLAPYIAEHGEYIEVNQLNSSGL